MRIFIVVSLMLTVVACQRGNTGEVDKQEIKDEKEKVVINVETAESYVGNSTATFKSTAILAADRAAMVTTKTAGIILDIKVEEGDPVKKGDVLMVLESDEQRLTLKSATANYEKSLNNLTRAEKIFEKGLTNKEQIDNLRFETKSLKASMDQARMNLSFTQIKAPFDGLVTKRLVKIGNLIQNATAVFEVVDFDSLQAKIDVPEHQWHIMKRGLNVEFKFDALPNQTINGEVIRVSPIIDSTSGTFEVTVAVDNSEGLLRPGLFAKANIIFDERSDVVLVNKDAIIREDELSFVYIVENENQIKKQQVNLGYEMPDSYEITSGLSPNQEVVTTGKNNLTPDVAVNVVKYDQNAGL